MRLCFIKMLFSFLIEMTLVSTVTPQLIKMIAKTKRKNKIVTNWNYCLIHIKITKVRLDLCNYYVITKSNYLLYVHFKSSRDVGRVQLVPAAIEAFRVGVGSTGDRGLPRRNYRENENKTKDKTVRKKTPKHYVI